MLKNQSTVSSHEIRFIYCIVIAIIDLLMVLAISDTRSIPLVLFAVVVPTAGIVVDPVPVFYVAPNSPIDPQLNTQGAGNIRGLDLQGTPNARSIGANLKITL